MINNFLDIIDKNSITLSDLSDLNQVKKFNLSEIFTFEFFIIFLILISVILLRIFYKNK